MSNPKYEFKTCPYCNGEKEFVIWIDNCREFEYCPECKGTGEIIVLRNGPGNQQENHHELAKMDEDI